MLIERVVLIEPQSPHIDFFSHARMPLLGLPILGAILQEMKIKVKIFCEKLAPIDRDEVSRANVVGIVVLTNLATRAYQIAEWVRQIAQEAKRKIFIVMGGPHVTFLPEEALRKGGADFVVRHEGEGVFKELMKYLQGIGTKDLKEIRGLSYRDGEEIRHNPDRPLIEDLDQIPLPDFSLIQGQKRINVVPLQTSRGCSYKKCEYCTVVSMFGGKARHRSPESVVEEIKRAPPRKHIFVVDDNFSDDTDWTLSLLEAMKRAGIKRKWSTQDRVSVARKPDILKLMKKTGCVRLCQGIESFNPEALKEWHKGQTPEEIEEAVPIIHSHGLLIHGMFMLGADADSRENIEDTTDSAIHYGFDTAQFFVLVPPPGTGLYQRLKQEGRIFDNDWSHYDGQYVVFWPKQMSPWQLQEMAIKATQKFYTFRRGIKWALKFKGENSYFAFHGRRVLKRWLRENKEFLEQLFEKTQSGELLRQKDNQR